MLLLSVRKIPLESMILLATFCTCSVSYLQPFLAVCFLHSSSVYLHGRKIIRKGIIMLLGLNTIPLAQSLSPWTPSYQQRFVLTFKSLWHCFNYLHLSVSVIFAFIWKPMARMRSRGFPTRAKEMFYSRGTVYGPALISGQGLLWFALYAWNSCAGKSCVVCGLLKPCHLLQSVSLF